MSIANLSESERRDLDRYIEDMVTHAVDLREATEQAQALGVPPVAFDRHAGMRVREDRPIAQALNEFRPVAEARLGKGTFREQEVGELLEKAVLSRREYEHLKRVVRGFKADQFAIEKYVEIRAHNPLDKGLSHLREMNALAGYQAEAAPQASGSGEPVQKATAEQVSARRSARRSWLKGLVVDVALGLGIGVSALMLLT
ncbi:hypothetical protein Q4485_07850 [Granulosicoccaceae sp. 1_MG-2023]|nr:hypothetical protein [Granulosicoccaceae sp. 1_MG-2023]